MFDAIIPSSTYPHIQEDADTINSVLSQYGISLYGYIEAPRLIQYRAKLTPDVNTNKLLKLESNLKIALDNDNVELFIKGNQFIIQKPGASNKVQLAELVKDDFLRSMPLTLILGKDTNNERRYADLAKQPHMLVAGTTGSGKSMLLHQFIISLLVKDKPIDIIAVDTKQVEFNCYGNAITVLNDAEAATIKIEYLVDLMNHRYKRLSELGYRDFYEAKQAGITDKPIVVIIDEFADLIMQKEYTKRIESAVVKLAQKARAAGIHLIIATQRPTSDVLTGLIKANIPSRVCLKVSSAMESRIIIDRKGGENLLGNGDLLFIGKGDFEPKRIQACYVSDNEMNSFRPTTPIPQQPPVNNWNRCDVIEQTHTPQKQTLLDKLLSLRIGRV